MKTKNVFVQAGTALLFMASTNIANAGGDIVAVPEPGPMGLLVQGVAALLIAKRTQRHK